MKKIFLLTISLFVSGCAANASKNAVDLNLEDSSEDMAVLTNALIDAANSASESLRILAEVNNAEKAPLMTDQVVQQMNWNATYTPDGMDVDFPIYWNASFMPILESLANHTGYEIKEEKLSLKPVQLPTVKIDTSVYRFVNGVKVYDNRAVDVLRSIAYQIDAYNIHIDVLESSRIIKVVYGRR